jgi:CheY-like chemotaxis protein
MSTDRNGLHILLVDDSDDDRYLFMAAFNKSGVRGQVVQKEDGDEAIEFLMQTATKPTNSWPDAVFLDLKMPGRNGFEFLEWVRDHPALKPLRIFVLSGSNEPPDIQRARELGALEYVVKPIRAEKIQELLKSAPRDN